MDRCSGEVVRPCRTTANRCEHEGVKRQVQFVRSVDLPYGQIRCRLRDGAQALLGKPDADGAVATLAAHFGDVEISRDMKVRIIDFIEANEASTGCTLLLTGDASEHPDLFPHLEARLDAVSVGDDRTVVFFAANYTPPLGVVGNAVDAVLLHKFAEDSLEALFSGAIGRLG